MSDEKFPMPAPKIGAGFASIILAVVIQSCAAVWWASGMERRMSALEQDHGPDQTARETVARLDERTKDTEDAVLRLERKLDTLQRINP